MSRLLFGLACIVALFAGLADAADTDAAFQVDRRSFKDTYRTIALAPVDFDPYLEMPASVAAIIEEEITERLEKEKFTVIPSSTLAAIRATMETQVGGLENPETGEIDPGRQQAVREHAFRELWFRENFDALGIIRVSILRVPMASDEAEWDGVKQKLEHKGRSRQYTGNVAVSSVTLGLFDSTNKPIYTWYGGLEPLMYREDDQLLPLGKDRLFQDEDKIREAAEIAVDPF